MMMKEIASLVGVAVLRQGCGILWGVARWEPHTTSVFANYYSHNREEHMLDYGFVRPILICFIFVMLSLVND